MKNNDDIDQIINKAVNWWIEKLENPIELSTTEDEYTKEQMLTMISIINNAKKENELTQEKIEIFKLSLTEQLEEALSLRGECILCTDYDPKWQLKTAAKTAKIDDSVFPWKITMKINTEKVEVSEGYNKPYKTIYKKCKVTKTKKYN